MLNFANLLAQTNAPTVGESSYTLYMVISITLIILMAIAAIALIVLILLQPSNSSGIDALGGSSETFFGKHKGKSVEAKMKKWTWIALAVLAVFAIVFFVLQILPIW